MFVGFLWLEITVVDAAAAAGTFAILTLEASYLRQIRPPPRRCSSLSSTKNFHIIIIYNVSTLSCLHFIVVFIPLTPLALQAQQEQKAPTQKKDHTSKSILLYEFRICERPSHNTPQIFYNIHATTCAPFYRNR